MGMRGVEGRWGIRTRLGGWERWFSFVFCFRLLFLSLALHKGYFNQPLRAGKRLGTVVDEAIFRNFNLLSPRGEETLVLSGRVPPDAISTHSSLARGRDHRGRNRFQGVNNFNPLFPAREETCFLLSAVFITRFQPTLPAREKTYAPETINAIAEFQPTLPRVGKRQANRLGKHHPQYFNPLFPAWGRDSWNLM